MQDLTPVGLSEDGTAVVLSSTTGTRYAAAVARLRELLPPEAEGTGRTSVAAVVPSAAPSDETVRAQPAQPIAQPIAQTRAQRGRPGEKTMDSVLRPRDIQTRIRAGESPESVAEAARTTVDKIMGFAAPVLAERAYVAEQAQTASIRRRAGEGPAAHLGEAVEQRLRSLRVDPVTAEWDAWRREDRRWTLVVDYVSPDGPQRAEFVYDAAGRYVVAENDQSRWLVGERAAPSAGGPGRRLASVDDEQLPLGDDAIEVVTGRRPMDSPLPLQFPQAGDGTDAGLPRNRHEDAAPAGGDDSLTEDLTEVQRSVRQPGSAGADADWISTQASERPAGAPSQRTSQPTPGVDQSDKDDSAPPTDAAPDEETSADAKADAKAAAKRRGKGKGKGRASVPSWDEIMFGSGRPD